MSKLGGPPSARSDAIVFVLADCGFCGAPGPADDFDPVPDRAPDRSVERPTQPKMALLYRLNNVRKPLHAEPAFARKAGFDRPILHGLATYGVAAVAIAKAFPDKMLTSVENRFSKPVFPGETVSIDVWDEGEGAVAFRARVAVRDVTVLDRGRATLA